jgi:hypothetical protein
VVVKERENVTETSATLPAQINPEGSETRWEIYLECQAPLPSQASRTSKCEPVTGGRQLHEGRLVAGTAPEMVQAEMTGLQPGYSYTYTVIAGNSAGREGWVGVEFATCLPLGSCPTGGWPGDALWGIEDAERAGAEAVRREAELEAKKKHEEEEKAAHERAIREAGERAGKEAAQREAAERAAAERAAAERAAAATSHALKCVVPRLKGDSLTAAHRALDRAHCSLGKVIEPKKHRGRLVVVAQSVQSGRTLAKGSKVAVTLRPLRSKNP